MRFPFKAIGLGLIIGGALFFVPFIFRFIFFALLIGLIIRLATGGRRGRRHWGYPHYGRSPFPHQFGGYENGPVPIDGGRYHSGIKRNGPEQSFPIS